MNTLVISVADDTLRALEEKAQDTGKSTAQIAAEVIEDVFGNVVNGPALYSEKSEPEIVRERLRQAGLLSVPDPPSADVPASSEPADVRSILAAAGMLRPLGDDLLALIDDDIPSLEEVIETLSSIPGPSLTEILDQHRGPRQ